MSVDPLRVSRHFATAVLVTVVVLATPSWTARADPPGAPSGVNPAVTATAGGIVEVVEFYNAKLLHYFITADPSEIAALDGGAFGGAWKRTGHAFLAWETAGAPAGTVPVCRFFGTDQYRPDGSRIGPNSHFYTADPDECEYVKTAWQSLASDGKSYPAWTFESNAFAVRLAIGGVCPSDTLPLARAYNNGARGDPNHRYATENELLEVLAPDWIGEGQVMCLPSPPVFFVSATRGDDTNSGRQVAPFRTIRRGHDAAFAGGGGIVRIAGGSYPETLRLRSNVHLVGAHNPDTWAVDPANFTTLITGGAQAVWGAAISNVVLRNLMIVSARAEGVGSSSIALALHGARGILVAGTRLQTRDASNGTDGLPGTAGANGANGGAGAAAGGTGAGGTGGGGGAAGTARRGGNGGIAGSGFQDAGNAGAAGAAGGPSVAPGGAGGAGGRVLSNGLTAGMQGEGGYTQFESPPGANASGIGRFVLQTFEEFVLGIEFLPAVAVTGAAGPAGGGGGGGGGGAVGFLILPLTAGGGGGGGQGGGGGGGGGAGSGGGSSIGLIAIGGSDVTIFNTNIQTGNGGAGGLGGEGGLGGVGGNGGAGGAGATVTLQMPGGRGGNGGRGTEGSRGGSGRGGHSVGIVFDASSTFWARLNTFTVTLGTAGARAGTPSGTRQPILVVP